MNYILTTTSSPNFCDEKGNVYLVRCPVCKQENISTFVATGICIFCKINLHEHKIIDKEK